MKQISFITEFVTDSSGSDLFIVREPRSGQIVAKCTNLDEFRTYISELISKLKNSENHES